MRTTHRTQSRYEDATRLIPGGTQLLSKRPELHAPGCWPAYAQRAAGCEVWDLDGNHYYDMSLNGIGSCLLGFADPDVTKAVVGVIESGSMSSLNPPEEVELAERLCAIHPWAEQVRFARTGGEACAMAVRIARATTGRDHIAVCGYHGWHDWYLAANLQDGTALDAHLLPGLDPNGVPQALRGTTHTFTYNDLSSFDEMLNRCDGRLAAVIMEPCRDRLPEDRFLELVRDRAHGAGALLIIDEITMGWRMGHGGAHLSLGTNPDIAIFAKALGNGHPIAAVIGTREAMEGAHHAFISSTYWTERVGPAAALATIEKLECEHVSDRIAAAGEGVQNIWREAASEHDLPITLTGLPCLPKFNFDLPLARESMTLFTQCMLDREFLATSAFYPTLAHTNAILSRYADAVNEVFGTIAHAHAEGEVEVSLRGPVSQPPFARLT